jgi:hypothetical protein
VNMNVLNRRDLGEIMAGHFTVPQNPMIPGLAGCPKLKGNGMGKLGRIGQVCSPGGATSPSDCLSAGGYYDSDNEVCVCNSGAAPLTGTPVATGTCATSPCSWTDYIWASQPCINWYAQCNPTSPFYLAVTKGALAATGSVAGQAVGATANGLFDGLAATLGIPVWGIYAVLGLVAYKMVTK